MWKLVYNIAYLYSTTTNWSMSVISHDIVQEFRETNFTITHALYYYTMQRTQTSSRTAGASEAGEPEGDRGQEGEGRGGEGETQDGVGGEDMERGRGEPEARV